MPDVKISARTQIPDLSVVGSVKLPAAAGSTPYSIDLDQIAAYTETALNFGTAAQQDIGAGGNAVPLLSNANTWSETQTFTGGFNVRNDALSGDPEGLVRTDATGNLIFTANAHTPGSEQEFSFNADGTLTVPGGFTGLAPIATSGSFNTSTLGLIEQTGVGTYAVRAIGSTNSTDILTKGAADALYASAGGSLTKADVVTALGYTPTSITGYVDAQTPEQIKTGLALVKADVGLGNVEDKSAATILSEMTSLNVTTALGYTPTSVTGATGSLTVSAFKTALSLTSADVGLGNVENKSSATIRGEITSSNVTTALGYTPVTNARTVTGTGLVFGGGALSSNQTLYVTAATTTTMWASSTEAAVTPDALYDAAVSQSLGTTSGTITLNGNNGINFHVTLNGNATLANPSNFKAGQSGRIRITQDATGSRTMSYGSAWRCAGGTSFATLTTTASAVDVITYYCHSTTDIEFWLSNDMKN